MSVPPYLQGEDSGDEQYPAWQGLSSQDLAQVRSYLEGNPPSFSIRQLQGFTQFIARSQVIDFVGVRTLSTWGDLGKVNPGDPEPEVGPQLTQLGDGQYLALFGATVTEKGPAGTTGQIGLEIDGVNPTSPYIIGITEPIVDLVFPQPVSRGSLVTLRNQPLGGHSVIVRYQNSNLALTSLTAFARWLILLRFNTP